MQKGKIILNSDDQLDYLYEKLMEELFEISGENSVIQRKDNDDVWKEYEVYSERKYIIETIFTDDEIAFLQKYYKHKFELI